MSWLPCIAAMPDNWLARCVAEEESTGCPNEGIKS